MYLKLPGHTRYLIKNLYEVWLPPQPHKSAIHGWELKKSDQYWRRQPLPAFYEERRAEEEAEQQKEADLVAEGSLDKVRHFDPILERYRRQEWHRRLYGFWFMNNGKPVYLTGAHYTYLQWCKLDSPINDGYPTFYMSQVPRFYFRQLCWEDPFSFGYFIVGPRGFGKCHGIDTVVRMYHGGTKKVQDVVIGDLLMGPDSKPRAVLKLYSGQDELYEVVQNQAMNYTVTGNHVLSLRRNSSDGCRFKIRKDRPNPIPVYPEFGEVANIKAEDLKNRSATFYNTFSGYKVGVDYEEKPCLIDPYFLGVWLGDGTSEGPFFTSMDQEVVDSVDDYIKSIGLLLNKRGKKGRASTYSIISPGFRTSTNKLLNLLRAENLIGNKHIPENYLYTSVENRLQLLAGLLDTDGSCWGNIYEISQVRKDLAYQIKLLADTLGFKTGMKEKVINGTIYYRLHISGHAGSIPCRIPRKQCSPNPNKDHRLTKIKDIIPIGVGDYFGFELDGDHLYLLEDGTVTHNSTEETWSQLENITKSPTKRNAAIQSKNKDDAETMFTEKMVPMFNELPHFFKPQYNHGSNPVKGMNLSRERSKGKLAKKIKYGPEHELGNTVRHFPAKEKALDGRTLVDIIQDELGKLSPTEEADAYVRLGVVIRCMYRNDKKIGIIRATSTIEAMKEGGKEAKKIWDDSDPRNRDANGYTKSKIYKYFVSGLETKVKFADKHGEIDEEKAYQAIMNDRDAVKDDPEELISRMRKEPLVEEDAFIKDQSDSPFPMLIISETMNDLDRMKQSDLGRQGRLEYISGQTDTDVMFVDDPQGMFTVWHLPDEYRDKRKILNATRFEYGGEDGKQKLWIPVNDDLYAGGDDPIRWIGSVDKRASKFAGYGFRRYDPVVDDGRDPKDWESHGLMWKYHGRSLNPVDDFENMIKAMRYWGHRMNSEQNVGDFNKHLLDRGYWKFVITRREFDPTVLAGKTKNALSVNQAVNTNTEVINTYINRIIRFLVVHGRKIKDKELLRQLHQFDPSNPGSFDLVVALGYALIALEHKINFEYTQQDNVKVETFFNLYDNSGIRSRAIQEADDFDRDDHDWDMQNEINKVLSGR